jgi:UTP--glucose-1-phosphate uridylyltransferase
MPKEMLPVVDKPLIQYAVEEAARAGIRQMIFITGRHKRSIEDHFDRMPELEAELAAKGKNDLLAIVKDISPETDVFIYIRQPEPLGLGHAVLCAEPAVGDEPFAVILADDLIDSEQPAMGQLMQAREARGGGNVLAVEDVPRENTGSYGIVSAEALDERTSRITHIVEKPKPAEAPSTLAVLGRYVLEPGIFDHLRTIPRGSGGEIQLTDAIAGMVPAGSTYAYRYAGRRFDCGSKQGFLDATVHYARKAGYRI